MVVLRESVPDYGLKPGDVGTVVLVHKKSEAFEVEFLALDGETIGIATLTVSQVRPALKKKSRMQGKCGRSTSIPSVGSSPSRIPFRWV